MAKLFVAEIECLDPDVIEDIKVFLETMGALDLFEWKCGVSPLVHLIVPDELGSQGVFDRLEDIAGEGNVTLNICLERQVPWQTFGETAPERRLEVWHRLSSGQFAVELVDQALQPSALDPRGADVGLQAEPLQQLADQD